MWVVGSNFDMCLCAMVHPVVSQVVGSCLELMWRCVVPLVLGLVASSLLPAPSAVALGDHSRGPGADVGDAPVWSFPETSLLRSNEMAVSEAHNGARKAHESGPGPTFRVCLTSIGLHGHAMPLIRLADELKSRGHDVVFASHDRTEALLHGSGVKFVSAGPLPFSHEAIGRTLVKVREEQSNFRGMLTLFNELYLPLARPFFQNLHRALAEDPPDVFVVDISTLGGLDLAEHLGVPVVINSPSVLFRLDGKPSHLPSWGSGFQLNMTTWQRCISVLRPRLLSVALTPSFMHVNKVRWAVGLPAFPSQDSIFSMSRILVNTALGFEYAQDTSPLVTYTGPLLPRGEGRVRRGTVGRPLPTGLDAWLRGGGGVPGDSAGTSGGGRHSDGRDAVKPRGAVRKLGAVVYVSLGHMLQLGEDMAAMLMEAFTEGDPKFRVVWFVSPDQRLVLPELTPTHIRIKTLGQVPHLRVLAHPAVRAVLTSCGMASVQEALYFAKPVLCLPSMADQADVAARVLDAGVGLSLHRNDVSAGAIRSALHRLLVEETRGDGDAATDEGGDRHNGGRSATNSYIRSARFMASVMSSAGGTERAADVVLDTAEFGLSHLVSWADSVPWHEAHGVDVIVLVAAILVLMVALVYVALGVLRAAVAISASAKWSPTPSLHLLALRLAQGVVEALKPADDTDGRAAGGQQGREAAEEHRSHRGGGGALEAASDVGPDMSDPVNTPPSTLNGHARSGPTVTMPAHASTFNGSSGSKASSDASSHESATSTSENGALPGKLSSVTGSAVVG